MSTATTGYTLNACIAQRGFGGHTYMVIGSTCGLQVGLMVCAYNVGIFFRAIGVLATIIAWVVGGSEYIFQRPATGK